MKKDVQEKAFNYFNSGFHCAESIAKAILEHYGENLNPEWVKAASAFQGGVGKCKKDMCGAFSGGIVALGVLKGRSDLETDHSDAVFMANAYREAFIQKFDSTNCAELLKTIVDPDPEYTCKHLTSEAAGLLADVIEKGVERD